MTTDDTAGRGFDSELSIRAVTATTWSLLAPLVWTGTKGDTFTVPVGFVTDFATVPRFLHWLALPYGPYTRAAVLHDYLLVELARWTNETRSGGAVGWLPPANSRDTDGIFRRVMEDLGTPWAKRWVMWAAVRAAACFNSRRSYGRGFLADSPRVLAIGLAAAPFLLPGAVGVLISLILTRVFAGSGPKSAPTTLDGA